MTFIYVNTVRHISGHILLSYHDDHDDIIMCTILQTGHIGNNQGLDQRAYQNNAECLQINDNTG